MLESLVKWSATIAVFGTLCPLLMIEFGTLPAVDPTLYAHTDEALEERCMAEVKQVHCRLFQEVGTKRGLTVRI